MDHNNKWCEDKHEELRRFRNIYNMRLDWVFGFALPRPKYPAYP